MALILPGWRPNRGIGPPRVCPSSLFEVPCRRQKNLLVRNNPPPPPFVLQLHTSLSCQTHAMRQSQPLTFQQFGTPDSPYTNITTATETNYPDPNIVFATEGNLSAVTSASGGRWYLVVEVDCGIPENDPRDEYCHGVDYATWGITVRGLIGLPNRSVGGHSGWLWSRRWHRLRRGGVT